MIEFSRESKAATQWKFDLLDVDLEDLEAESGTDCVVVDVAVLKELLHRSAASAGWRRWI